jgi:hypothetical protein
LQLGRAILNFADYEGLKHMQIAQPDIWHGTDPDRPQGWPGGGGDSQVTIGQTVVKSTPRRCGSARVT